MIAYLLAPVFAFISSVVIFLPSEVMLLVLANMDKMPVHLFGHELHIEKYATSFPWLLPVMMAFGSNGGSAIYFYMGTGALKTSGKLKNKMETFDFTKFERARNAVVFISCVTSIPPVSVTAIASGMTEMKFAKYFYVSLAGKFVRYYLVLILGKFAVDAALRWLT
jgi:membrane protein YqaA with SNARE-associated domain